MFDTSDLQYFAARAAQARDMAARAATPTAQALHRQLAENYTARAGQADAPGPVAE